MVQFYDANKMQVGDPQQWQLVTIYPNEDQPVKCMATAVEATDFKIEFSNILCLTYSCFFSF